eukprot:gene28785-31973_t
MHGGRRGGRPRGRPTSEGPLAYIPAGLSAAAGSWRQGGGYYQAPFGLVNPMQMVFYPGNPEGHVGGSPYVDRGMPGPGSGIVAPVWVGGQPANPRMYPAQAKNDFGVPVYSPIVAAPPPPPPPPPRPAQPRGGEGGRGGGGGGGGGQSGGRRDNRLRGRPRVGSVVGSEKLKRTVYVKQLNLEVTEEELANFFNECGQVVDCRICGDPKAAKRMAFIEFENPEGAVAAIGKTGSVLNDCPLHVLPSKTSIVPVKAQYMAQSEEEIERCNRTVYVSNIDKKVTDQDVCQVFGRLCGPVSCIRLLTDRIHHTSTAFVEFVDADSAVAALNCSGAQIGSLPIRVAPSKTPVRPEAAAATLIRKRNQHEGMPDYAVSHAMYGQAPENMHLPQAVYIQAPDNMHMYGQAPEYMALHDRGPQYDYRQLGGQQDLALDAAVQLSGLDLGHDSNQSN